MIIILALAVIAIAAVVISVNAGRSAAAVERIAGALECGACGSPVNANRIAVASERIADALGGSAAAAGAPSASLRGVGGSGNMRR